MPRFISILLLCLAATAMAGDVEDLADPAKRAKAYRKLSRRGTPALKDLRQALEKTVDKEVRETIGDIIKDIEKREPHGLRFNAGVPKMKLDTMLVNSAGFKYSVSVRNRGDKPVVLWPYLSLRVLDATGKELKPSRRRGRHGLRRTDNPLEKVGFVTIRPGKFWSFKDGIAAYMHDAHLMTGWEIPGPGNYTLEFTYHFDRAAEKKRCDPKWKRLDDPKEPWNTALAFKHTFTAEMRVS